MLFSCCKIDKNSEKKIHALPNCTWMTCAFAILSQRLQGLFGHRYHGKYDLYMGTRVEHKQVLWALALHAYFHFLTIFAVFFESTVSFRTVFFLPSFSKFHSRKYCFRSSVITSLFLEFKTWNYRNSMVDCNREITASWKHPSPAKVRGFHFRTCSLFLSPLMAVDFSKSSLSGIGAVHGVLMDPVLR